MNWAKFQMSLLLKLRQNGKRWGPKTSRNRGGPKFLGILGKFKLDESSCQALSWSGKKVGWGRGWVDPYKSTDSCHPRLKPAATFRFEMNKQTQLLQQKDLLIIVTLASTDLYCGVWHHDCFTLFLQRGIFTGLSDIILSPIICIYNPLEGLSIFLSRTVCILNSASAQSA